MIEVAKDLWVGTEADYEKIVAEHKTRDWHIISAAKNPFHLETVGYHTGQVLNKLHPEYLIAYRKQRMVLNLIDAPDPSYIPAEIINSAVEYIKLQLKVGHKVFLHCNMGRSRSPSIALAYLRHTKQCSNDFDTAMNDFAKKYPDYTPAGGMRGYLEANWNKL